MLAIDTGSTFSVTVTMPEVTAFNRSWPCSTIPNIPITFVFEKRTGDLVDIIGTDADGEEMLALSEDAQQFGETTLGISTWHTLRR